MPDFEGFRQTETGSILAAELRERTQRGIDFAGSKEALTELLEYARTLPAADKASFQRRLDHPGEYIGALRELQARKATAHLPAASGYATRADFIKGMSGDPVEHMRRLGATDQSVINAWDGQREPERAPSNEFSRTPDQSLIRSA